MSYPFLSLRVVKEWEPLAAKLGVSNVARGRQGFLRAYERAGSPSRLPPEWLQKRDGFIARHMAQMQREPLYGPDGLPTRRHLALIMWAYSPREGRVTPNRKLRLSVLIPNRIRANGTWRDYIRGEWWIDSTGQSMFADQDIGEAGHEQIAIDNMVDAQLLVEGLVAWYRSRAPLSEGWSRREADEKADELSSMEHDPAELVLNDYVPDSVGAKAAGGKARWEAIKTDARRAYAKYEGAILAIDRDFAAHKVTESTISAIQSFIEEQAESEDEIDDQSTKICVEQFEPQKFVCMPVAEFLLIRKPKDLWVWKGATPNASHLTRPIDSAEASEFPKRCNLCGTDYTTAQWRRLPLVGYDHCEWGDVLEYRNCPCGTTLAIYTHRVPDDTLS